MKVEVDGLVGEQPCVGNPLATLHTELVEGLVLVCIWHTCADGVTFVGMTTSVLPGQQHRKLPEKR